LIPVEHAEDIGSNDTSDLPGCLVAAQDLIGAWVTAGGPESESFPFTGVNGETCEGTYANDVQHLFVDNNVWYAGQLGCVSCHNADQPDRSGGLDLSSYQAITASNTLGNGDWESSTLYAVLFEQGLGPDRHVPEAEPFAPVLIYAGQQVVEAEVTPTATP
jgi:hypothetical protein